VVRDALSDAAANGSLTLRRHDAEDPGGASDLTLIFAHGGGSGLTFRTGSAARRMSAVHVATTLRARVALVASCWSLAPPPVSFPMTLPAAMMLNGASCVVGGLWPLPSEPTADVVAATIADLARGRPLAAALAAARARTEESLLARWGLAVHGLA